MELKSTVSGRKFHAFTIRSLKKFTSVRERWGFLNNLNWWPLVGAYVLSRKNPQLVFQQCQTVFYNTTPRFTKISHFASWLYCNEEHQTICNYWFESEHSDQCSSCRVQRRSCNAQTEHGQKSIKDKCVQHTTAWLWSL